MSYCLGLFQSWWAWWPCLHPHEGLQTSPWVGKQGFSTPCPGRLEKKQMEETLSLWALSPQQAMLQTEPSLQPGCHLPHCENVPKMLPSQVKSVTKWEPRLPGKQRYANLNVDCLALWKQARVILASCTSLQKLLWVLLLTWSNLLLQLTREDHRFSTELMPRDKYLG